MIASMIESDNVAQSLRARLSELRLERGKATRQAYDLRYRQWCTAVAQVAQNPRKRYATPPVVLHADGQVSAGVHITTIGDALKYGVGVLPRGEQVRRDYRMRANQWREATWRANRASVRHLRHDVTIDIDAHGFRVDGQDSFAPMCSRDAHGCGQGISFGNFSMTLSPTLPSEEAAKLIAKVSNPKTWNAGKKPTRKRIPTVSRKLAAERVAKAIANGDVVKVA